MDKGSGSGIFPNSDPDPGDPKNPDPRHWFNRIPDFSFNSLIAVYITFLGFYFSKNVLSFVFVSFQFSFNFFKPIYFLKDFIKRLYLRRIS